jgi:nicotinate-nucleotide adenylyltransferase
MPSKNPPHKAKPTQVTDQQRVEMIALAIGDNPHFALSTMELERSGYTYTADTLTLLKKENPEAEYYFIVGADSLFMMHQWYQPQTIFSLCTVVAAGRDNVEYEKLKQQAEFLKQQYQAKIMLLDMPTIQIASEEIRKRLKEQKSVRYYLPEAVIDFINKNGLYMTASED